MSKKEEQTETPTMVEVETNKKRKWKVLLCGLFILIAIAIGLYIGYQKLNSNPIAIYKNAINEAYDKLNSTLKKMEKNDFSSLRLNEEPISLDIKATLDSNMEELKNFTDLTYNLNMGIDLKNQKILGSVSINDQNETIISGDLAAVNNNIYAKSTELFDKVLDLGEYNIFEEVEEEIGIEDFNIILSYDNYEYILKSIKDILINSLDKDKFTIEQEKITINNKEYNAKKVIYNLDEENMKRTNKFIIDSILKDEKLLEALANSTGKKVEELKEALKDTDNENSYSNVKIILYTDALNNVIAGSIYEEETEIIKFDCVKKANVTIELEQTKLTLTEEEDFVHITGTNGEEEKINLKLYEENNGLKIEYEIDSNGTRVTGIIETKNKNKLSNNEIYSDFKFSANATILGKEYAVALDGSITLTKGELQIFDTTNSKKIEELTESELTKAYVKLSSILKRLGLSDLINSL